MSHELTPSSSQIIELLEQDKLTTLIKPLVKEILLFETYIAGTSYIQDQHLFEQLQIGEHLYLIRESGNTYDEKAIIITNKNKQKLGYIPKKDNIIFSRLLDAGKLLSATIKDIKKEKNYYRITININLIDF